MTSTRTTNRIKKVELLKKSMYDIMDLLMLEHKYRDFVNMKHFKELSSKVKTIKDMAKPL